MPPDPDIYKALRLPPGFAAQRSDAAWPAALEAAAAGVAPGTVIHGPGGAVLEAAIILTPDQPVADGTVLRLGMLAILDVLAAHVPPENVVSALTPRSVAVNGGEVARVTVARGPGEVDGAPAWILLGFNVRVALALDAPGLTPWLTDLAEEGLDLSAPDLLEALCRHVLAGVDLWQVEGEAGLDRAWRAIQPRQAA